MILYQPEYEKAFGNNLGPGPAAYSKIEIQQNEIALQRISMSDELKLPRPASMSPNRN